MEIEGEVWKDIPGFEGYRISNLGRVQSCRYGSKGGLKFKSWRFITPNLSSTLKYLQIDLVDPTGKRRSFSLHRILYEIFIGPIPEKMIVDHKDRNPINNSLDNLRLATVSQNTINRTRQKHRKYTGVYAPRNGKKWEARTSHKGKAISLGWYESEIEAAKAYNQYALEKFGEFAVLNPLGDA